MKKPNKRTLLAACLMVPLVSSCSAIGVGSECAAFIPVYVSKSDQFSDSTARQILQNNRTGAKLCEWKPNPATH